METKIIDFKNKKYLQTLKTWTEELVKCQMAVLVITKWEGKYFYIQYFRVGQIRNCKVTGLKTSRQQDRSETVGVTNTIFAKDQK